MTPSDIFVLVEQWGLCSKLASRLMDDGYGRPSPFRFVVGSCFHKTDFSHFLSPVYFQYVSTYSVRKYILSTVLEKLQY